MAKDQRSTKEELTPVHERDRYPRLVDVLEGILNDDTIPDGPVERLELTALANGEATYRYWLPRAEESEGGAMLFE